MEKHILYQAEVQNADFTSWKFPKLKDDGTVDWEVPPDTQGRGIPKRTPGDTIRLLRETVTAIPRSIQTSDDPEWVWRTLYHLHRNEDARDALVKENKEAVFTHVVLSPRVYRWLHELLSRKIPLNKEEREDQKYDNEKGEKEEEGKVKKFERQTYAQFLWGLSAYALKCALLDVEDRKGINLDEDP